MGVDQRLDALADRSPGERAAILDKIREYERLTQQARERRLWQTEFHYYFQSLRPLGVAARESALQGIDDPMRSRLWIGFQLWDSLDLETRDALIQERRAVTYLLTRVQELAAMEEAREGQLGVRPLKSVLEPSERASKDLEATHRMLIQNVDALLAQAGPMSEGEATRLRSLVEAFVHLPKQKRDESFRTILELAESTEGQRQAFVQEALNWRDISAEERAKWRYIATQLPPMPWDLAVEIGHGGNGFNLPPVPPGFFEASVRSISGSEQRAEARTPDLVSTE